MSGVSASFCSKFSVMLLENVRNMKNLKQAAIEEKLSMVLVNPALIYHTDQIFVAVNKSLHSLKYGQMKTRNVFTEILYSLSPSRSIKDSFKTFGVEDSSTSVIIIVSGEDINNIQNILHSEVQGNLVPLKMLPKYCNVDSIKKVYKLQHVTDDKLLKVIISKIAVKDI